MFLGTLQKASGTFLGTMQCRWSYVPKMEKGTKKPPFGGLSEWGG